MQDDSEFQWFPSGNQPELPDEEIKRREYSRENLNQRFEYGLEVGGWLKYGAWQTSDASLLLAGFPLSPHARVDDLTDGAHTRRQIAFRRILKIAKTWADMDGKPPAQWIEWARRLDLDIPPALLGKPHGQAKELTTRERNSLLTIIAALCDYSGINHQAHGAGEQIAKLTEEIGAAVSGDTVRRALAKIPDALESRMK